MLIHCWPRKWNPHYFPRDSKANFLLRLNTRKLMLLHGRSNSHPSDNAHAPVHVIGPRRHRAHESDPDLMVRYFFSKTTVKTLCADYFD